MQRYIKKTNHTSLCDTSLCDTSLFYVLLTRSISIVTTRHPCLLDEHQSLCEQAIQCHMNSKCCVRLCGFTSNVVPKARNQKYQASLIGQRLVGFLQLAYNKTNTTASYGSRCRLCFQCIGIQATSCLKQACRLPKVSLEFADIYLVSHLLQFFKILCGKK